MEVNALSSKKHTGIHLGYICSVSLRGFSLDVFTMKKLKNVL